MGIRSFAELITPRIATPRTEGSHSHLSAEFLGVPPEQLSDARLIAGLLIAAASAAGFGHAGMPSVRDQAVGGVSAVLVVDSGHIAVHSVPQRQVLLLDVVAPVSHDFRKVVEVLARRLTAREVKTATRTRG
jgi:S-adenosylmethionine/arginine decarboxylase-like enzyme